MRFPSDSISWLTSEDGCSAYNELCWRSNTVSTSAFCLRYRGLHLSTSHHRNVCRPIAVIPPEFVIKISCQVFLLRPYLPHCVVYALPEACPALLMFAISASLLMLRTPLTRSFRGSILLDSRTFARPSTFGERSWMKREKKNLSFGSKAKSVKIFDASPTIGVRSLESWLISPVCKVSQRRHILSVESCYLVRIEDIQGGLGARPHSVPLFRLCILWPHEKVECVVIVLRALP